jgi:integrase/recombinase XerD
MGAVADASLPCPELDARRPRGSSITACRAGVDKPNGSHTLRHAFITAALDAGVPLRDVQEAASHADPRTTMRYDRTRVSRDRHATYIVAAYLAGAAR